MAERRRRQRTYGLAFCSLLIWGLLIWGSARAVEEIAVIVAADAPRIELEQGSLRDIYLKKIFVDAAGRKLVPVNLPPDNPLRRAFSLALFHATGDTFQGYWKERYFHGVFPPYVLGSQAAVVRFVARTPGAIGYALPCYLEGDAADAVRPALMLEVPEAVRATLDGLCPPTRQGAPQAP